MAQRGIREFDGKRIILNNWQRFFDQSLDFDYKGALVGPETKKEDLLKEHPWLKTEKLVVKPDMLFGKRGKNGLVLYKNKSAGDVDFDFAWKWIEEKRKNETTLLSGQKGYLTHFLIEPFCPHEKEYYLAIKLGDKEDEIYFSLEGGINIEENWDSVVQINIGPMMDFQRAEEVIVEEFKKIADSGKFLPFVIGAYKLFKELHFAYLEFNPFVLEDGKLVLIDLVAKLDDTAHFIAGKYWGAIEFPAPFGRTLSPEEKYIKELDEKTGASLKLTVLNPQGKVWTLVAGGGASVVFADTIADLGHADEMANYGEYSGNPSTEETREYAKTIFDLMTRDGKKGKVLLIGGAIANFTDVAKTFTGIIQAMEEYAEKLRSIDVHVYVRRGGPNYKVGLKNLRDAGERLGLKMKVFGPETHMTAIVKMAFDENFAKEGGLENE
jgi:ATP-citrate lyase beta-subunit